MADNDYVETYDSEGNIRHQLTTDPNFGGSGGEWIVDANGDLVPEDGEPVSVADLTGNYPAKVRVFNAENESVESVDPANTTTPINDAIDIAAPVDGATVFVPPIAGLSEGATITGAEDVTIRGMAGFQSRIDFPDSVTPLVNTNSANYFSIENLQLYGGDASLTGTTGRTGVRVEGGSRNFSMKKVRVASLIGKAYYEPSTSAPFEMQHNYVRFSNIDAGNEVALMHADGSTGRANQWGVLAVDPADDHSAKNSKIMRIDGGQRWFFQSVNCGGASGPILDNQAGTVYIWDSNFEPNVQNSTPPYVFRVASLKGTVVRHPQATGGPNADYVFEVDGGGLAHLHASTNISNAYSLTNNVGVIRSAPATPMWFWPYGTGNKWDDPNATNTSNLRSMDETVGASVI